MPFYTRDSVTEQGLDTYATLTLPAAAVVIDVRQGRQKGPSLLDHLIVAAEDLAAAMRLQRIPRWRHLADCIEFLSLQELAPAPAGLLSPTASGMREDATFVLTARTGEQISIQNLADLAGFVGRTYLDAVRNARIGAIRDSDTDLAATPSEMIDAEQPTVRVFLIVDMDEPASVGRAARYARSFKAWTCQAHGPERSSRAAPLQTVFFCLNAQTAAAHDALMQASGNDPRAIDTVLLLERYSDDEAYIGGSAQLYHAELILHTLLLHWPDAFEKSPEDAEHLLIHAVTGAITPPWPIYTLGASALEHSAHWAARWLNYGIAARALETIGDARQVEQEEPLLKRGIQNWLEHWWQEVQAAIPSAIVGTCDELRSFSRLQHALATPAAHSNSPASTLQELAAFHRQVSELYTGPGDTLQQALESRGALLERIQRICMPRRDDVEDGSPPGGGQQSTLPHLYATARQFVPQNFQSAQGALPRAIRQLSILAESIATIREVERRPLDLAQCRAQFEHRADQAYEHLGNRLKLRSLPLLGRIQRSTVVSLLVVILLIIIAITGVGWQSSLTRLSAFPLSPLMVKALLVSLLVIAELLYIVGRNRAIHREYRQQRDALRNIVRGHLSAVGTVIAASAALAFLTWADLYATEEHFSPYERRLRELAASLKTVQQYAAHQHALADDRLKPMLKTSLRSLNNRREIVLWQQIEDAFLASWSELKADTPALAPLSEMLLRLLGAESLTELLADMRSRQDGAQPQGEAARFQTISLLLTAIALSAQIRLPDLSLVLPLLGQYAALKDRYLQEPSALNGSALEIAGILRESLLKQVREQSMSADAPSERQASPASALAAWVGTQFNEDPRLASIFDPDDVLERLASEKIAPDRLLDMLRTRCTLPARPAEIAGSDYYYLFIAPGQAGAAVIRSLDHLRKAQIQIAMFPDREKVVYLHVHRVRQLLPRALP